MKQVRKCNPCERCGKEEILISHDVGNLCADCSWKETINERLNVIEKHCHSIRMDIEYGKYSEIENHVDQIREYASCLIGEFRLQKQLGRIK